MKIKTHLANSYAVEEFVKYACEKLEIFPKEIEIDLLEVDGVNGMCIDLEVDSFLILVKDHEDQLETLAHELVHVKQYMKQNLGSLLGTQEYETSWWEQEARSLSKQIMEKFNERNDSEKQ